MKSERKSEREVRIMVGQWITEIIKPIIVYMKLT